VSILGGKSATSGAVSKLGKRKSFRDSGIDDDADELPARISAADPQLQKDPPAATAEPKSVAIPIQFKRNSDVIAASEVTTLENLAQAMRQLGSDARVLVEGHTDATGPAPYNLKLSMLRALSVKEHLVRCGVPARQLIVSGAGSSKLMIPANPTAGENRRVEFKRLVTEGF
jgi:outer membrane protein OmpA-like peptidoglycan-associated protein